MFPGNIGLGTSPQVWLFSDFEGYNLLRAGAYPPYLSFVQQARLERIRQARLLHDGRHWRLFLFEERTQFDFPLVRSQGREKPLYVPYNLCKLISRTSAGLLFGEAPAIKVDDMAQGQATEKLIARTALHRLLYNAAIEASADGEVFFEAVVQNGEVFLKRVDSADIFPQGLIQPDGQFKRYVKYNAQNTGTDDKPDWKLLITTYLPGKITRELKQLNTTGNILPMQLTLNQWPQQNPEDQPLEPETLTGIDRNTITFVPNFLVRDMPISDYDGLVEQQDKLNAKESQLAKVLSQNVNPKLAAPVVSGDGTGDLSARNDVFYFRNKEEIPQYITWTPQLQAAIEERDQTRSAMLILSQTPPLLLGIRVGAAMSAHNAYKSVRIETTSGLSLAQAKALTWKPAIARMLSVAQDLENTLPWISYQRKPLSLEMKDGLPVDTDAQAQEISLLRACGSMSVERSVEILLPDPIARAKELDALAEEKAAATPSIFFGATGTGKQGTTAADEAAIANDETNAAESDVPVAA